MKNGLDQELLDIVSHNVYTNKFPTNKQIGNYLKLLHNTIKEVKQRDQLHSVSTIIATDFVKAGANRIHEQNSGFISVTLYVYGNFRKNYSVLKQVSEALADFYMEIPTLPLIRPMMTAEWKLQKDKQGKVYQKIAQEGVIVFSAIEEAKYATSAT